MNAHLENYRSITFSLSVGLIYLSIMTLAWAETPLDQDGTKSDFSAIHVTGPLIVNVTQGEKTGVDHESQAVRVDYADDALFIEARPADGNTDSPIIWITLPELSELTVQGASEIALDGFSGDTLVIDAVNHDGGYGKITGSRISYTHLLVSANGRFEFDLAGKVTHQDVSIHGAGVYGAEGLLSETSIVAITGVGVLHVWTERWLDLDVDGQAQVSYNGAPWVNKQVSGNVNLNSNFTEFSTSL
ncbi:MAG: hypothetical protein GKR90_03475 [Pseudomonadales bacterium]|nr:hypothetical protein [Pseudomonadales bacterium]